MLRVGLIAHELANLSLLRLPSSDGREPDAWGGYYEQQWYL